MQTGLIVIHQQRPAPSWDFHLPHWDVWTTCLRHIAIGHSGEVGLDWEKNVPVTAKIYRDEEAYEFLLEIVSGLHSPLVAETEVFGQFKDFVENTFRQRQNRWALHSLMLQLVKDVKVIRRKFLTGLGGQSYGSISRKYLAHFSDLAILGSGRLVGDILPWIAKKNGLLNEDEEKQRRSSNGELTVSEETLKIFCRSPDKAEHLKLKVPEVELLSLNSQGPFSTQAVVLAAPVAASWWSEWSLGRFPDLRLVLDLRGESDRDPLSGKTSVVALQDFFEALEVNRRQTETAVSAAKKQIQLVVRGLREAIRHRPFGWDDLCA